MFYIQASHNLMVTALHAVYTHSVRWFKIFWCQVYMLYKKYSHNESNECERWSSQLISNLSNWNKKAWKKSGLPWDLNPWPTGAMLYQLSYEATHWERGQFIEFIFSRE